MVAAVCDRRRENANIEHSTSNIERRTEEGGDATPRSAGRQPASLRSRLARVSATRRKTGQEGNFLLKNVDYF
jgi:hypothetical protein